jgi:hypothetical protein
MREGKRDRKEREIILNLYFAWSKVKYDKIIEQKNLFKYTTFILPLAFQLATIDLFTSSNFSPKKKKSIQFSSASLIF